MKKIRNIGRIVQTCPIHKTILKQFQLDYMLSSSKAHVRAGYCSFCQCFYINAPECKESKFYINQGKGYTKIKQIKKSNYKQQQIMNMLNKGTRIKNNKHQIGTIIEKNKNEITVSYPDSKEVNTYLIPNDFKNGSISLLKRTDNKRFMAFIRGQSPQKKVTNKKETTKKVYILRKKDTDEIECSDNKVQEGEILKIIKTSRKDIRSLDNIIYKFQLVGSTYNHYSADHNVINKTINLAYVDNDGTISIVELVAHYCSRCKKYFDFEESFILQLQEHNLKANRFLTRFEDRLSNPIEFENDKLN